MKFYTSYIQERRKVMQDMKKIYEEYLEKPGSYRAEKLLHTKYAKREKYKID